MENNPEASIEQEFCNRDTGIKISELIYALHSSGYEDAVAYSSNNLTDLVMMSPESIQVDSFDTDNNSKFIDIGINRYLKLNSSDNYDYNVSESEQTIEVSEVSYWSENGVKYYYIDQHGNVTKVELIKSADGSNSEQIVSKPLETEAQKVVNDLNNILELTPKN